MARLATMYTPRTVAAACLYDTLRELDFHITNFEEWCADIGKVDARDVDGYFLSVRTNVEAIDDLRNLTRNGAGRSGQMTEH